MSIVSGVIVNTAKSVITGLFNGFRFIRHTHVYVGIPEEKNDSRGTVTNAELLYIHTNGSPANNIPPRPTIEPALKEPETLDQIESLLHTGLKQALVGNVAAARKSYEKAGMVGATAAQAKFGSGDLAPNAPSTIARKGSSAPLIDTGALRQAVTYVVRDE